LPFKPSALAGMNVGSARAAPAMPINFLRLTCAAEPFNDFDARLFFTIDKTLYWLGTFDAILDSWEGGGGE
jgi:hypothetical protein